MNSTVKKVSFYLILGFLPLASNFLLAPFFTRFLSPVEYGLLALAALFQNYMNIFMDLGLKGSFSRYYYRYFKKPAIVSALFSTVVVSIVVVALVIYSFFFVFGEYIFDFVFKNQLFTFQSFGHFVCVLALSSLLNAVILTYYRNQENLKMYAVVSLGTFFAMSIGSVLGITVYHYGALGSVIGKMCGAVLVIVFFLLIYFFRNKIRFERRLVWPLIKYGLPLIPFGLLNITIVNVDRFFVERYFDLSVLGQYNIGFLVSTIPFIMFNSFQSSINPGIIKLLEGANDQNRASNYKEINDNFKVMILFMGIMLWGMIAMSGLFIMFYVGPEYRDVIRYLPILMMAFIPMIYQNIFSIFLFFHYQSRLLPIISVFTLIAAVGLNFLLIPVLGIYGVAFAVLGKNVIYALVTFILVKRNGFFIHEVFVMPKYHVMNIILAAASVVSLIFIRVFPENYHFVTLAAGGVSGLFIFVIFRSELAFAIMQVKSRFRR